MGGKYKLGKNNIFSRKWKFGFCQGRWRPSFFDSIDEGRAPRLEGHLAGKRNELSVSLET